MKMRLFNTFYGFRSKVDEGFARNGDERFAKYLTKGRQVFVRGDVEARAYVDKEGKPRATLACHAQDVQLLGGGTQKQEQQQPTPQQPTPKNDLPF